MAKNIRVENDYSFPGKENDGIVFMSIKNPTNNGDYLSLYISHEDREIDRNMSFGLQQLHPLSLSKRANGSFALSNWMLETQRGSDDIIALKVPAGGYRIWSWSLGGNHPVGYSESYGFTVEKDKVVYIGRRVFQLNNSEKSFRIDIEDKYEEDKSPFLKEYPKLLHDNIKTNLAVKYRRTAQ